MEKHKGYQKLLEDGEIKTEKGLLYKLSKKFTFIERKYWELSRIGLYKIKNIPNIKTARSLLEIGCGSAASMSYIKRFLNMDAKFYGVDLEKNSFIPEWVEFFKVDIDKDSIPLPDNSVDVVLSIFVLEHLHNPQNLIKEAYRVLRKDGFLYLITENYTSIYIPSSEFNFYQDFTHVRPWTKKSLDYMARAYGFEVNNIKIIRPVEYFLLIPFLPILQLLNRNNNFIFWSFLFGSTLLLEAKK